MRTTRWNILGSHVDFVDCIEITEEFKSILTGWNIEEVPFRAETPPYITFRKKNGRYSWDAPWIPEKARHIDLVSETVMDAVCNFHYEFIDWFVDRNTSLFCLHTACVMFGNAGVLFPCVQKAGKSTLSMQLVQMGHKLFGDDVVCLSENGQEAQALGLAPRIRLPLPEKVLTPELITFVQGRKGLSDDHWQYVNLKNDEIASLSETCSIGGIVVLERGASGSATLDDLPKSLALKALIDQNFGRIRDPDGIFDCLKSLAMRVPCKVLKYTRPDDAADVLRHYFGNDP